MWTKKASTPAWPTWLVKAEIAAVMKSGMEIQRLYEMLEQQTSVTAKARRMSRLALWRISTLEGQNRNKKRKLHYIRCGF